MTSVDLHPLPDDIRARIVKELRTIENDHNVKILYACESGSRAWGFASPNSDYDVRFIYVPKPDFYVDIDQQRRVIDLQIPEFDLDITGWSLDKALGLMRQSNPALLEWLNSPLVYIKSEGYDELKELALLFFNPFAALKHYSGMAESTYRLDIAGRDEVIFKKYFYVIRPLLAWDWVVKNKTTPPTEFEKLVADADLSDEFLKFLEQLLEAKRTGGEKEKGSSSLLFLAYFNEYIRSKLFVSEHFPFGKRTEKQDDAPLKMFLKETVRKHVNY